MALLQKETCNLNFSSGICHSARDTLGCLCRGQFPQKSLIINGSFAKRNLQLQVFSVESVISRVTLSALIGPLTSAKTAESVTCTMTDSTKNALSCRSLSAKVPLILGLFWGNWPRQRELRVSRALWKIPLEILHPQDPPHRKSDSPRYKFKWHQISKSELVPRDTGKSEFLDSVVFGNVVFYVESVTAPWHSRLCLPRAFPSKEPGY